jgi:hypothetical protein
MPVVLVNPLDETPRPEATPAPRIASLSEKRVALLDISKPGGTVFLDRVEALLIERYGVADVIRRTKPTFTRRAPESLATELIAVKPDALIEALAD